MGILEARRGRMTMLMTMRLLPRVVQKLLARQMWWMQFVTMMTAVTVLVWVMW